VRPEAEAVIAAGLEMNEALVAMQETLWKLHEMHKLNHLVWSNAELRRALKNPDKKTRMMAYEVLHLRRSR